MTQNSLHCSNLTQRKRAGLIRSRDTLKSLDRNQELLFSFSLHSLRPRHIACPPHWHGRLVGIPYVNLAVERLD